MEAKIHTGTLKRVIWFTLLNFTIIVTLIVLTKGLIIGFLPFLIIYACLMPFIGLALSKSSAKKAYGVSMIEEGHQYASEVEWYRHTVYEICKRAGMEKMPEIGIYESADINAFATGRSKNSSMIAVSTSLLYGMSEEAVEAVIAHEVAHIMNGDMVTQTLLQSALQMVVGAFVLPIVIVRWGLFFVVDRDSAFIYYLTFIIEVIVGAVLFFLSSLLINKFSRQREFKADSLAAQLTEPEKMIQALRELEGPSLIAPPRKKYASLQFNGMARMFDLFSTHPSTDRRIKSIERQFYENE